MIAYRNFFVRQSRRGADALIAGLLDECHVLGLGKPVPGGLTGPGEYLATGHPKLCSRFIIRFHILVSATDDPFLFS